MQRYERTDTMASEISANSRKLTVSKSFTAPIARNNRGISFSAGGFDPVTALKRARLADNCRAGFTDTAFHYPTKAGLESNGEGRSERDGLFTSQECHILQKKGRFPVAFEPSVKTGYALTEDSRQVSNPIVFQ